MKNFLLLTACVLCLAAAGTAQNPKPKSDIAKTIANATPAALPQSPKDNRPMSDAQEDNLKGKVKSFAEYIIDLENGKTERTLFFEAFYGRDGNLIRTVNYNDSGYPRGVGVWGYIDGMRVSRWGQVVPPGGEAAEAATLEGITRITGGSSAPRDTRYDTMYRSKYDSQGRMIERATLANTGKVMTSTTYEYLPGNKRLEHYFAYGKEEIGQTMNVFDAKGNVIETWYYDDKKVNQIRTSTYQFDARGNWIVQKTSEKTNVNGKEVLKPISTSYRAITYYL